MSSFIIVEYAWQILRRGPFCHPPPEPPIRELPRKSPSWIGLSYNLGHNILELYNALVQVWFTTNKTKCDVSIANLVYELSDELLNDLRLGKITKYWENLKSGWRQSAQPSFQKLNFGNSSQTLVFMWNSEIRESFNLYFSAVFC